MVKHCVGSYDKTSGKQCKYGWGNNYRLGGTGFGCLSGDSCKVLPRTECGAEIPLNYEGDGPHYCDDVDNAQQCNVSWLYAAPLRTDKGSIRCNWNWDKGQCEHTYDTCITHTNSGTDEFCAMSSNDQWVACNTLTDQTSCSKYGDGCKWTNGSAFGVGTGKNNYPGCIVNCTGCNSKELVDYCEDLGSEGACENSYEVPNFGNTKLCIWDSSVRYHGCHAGYESDDGTNDRFCTRQKLSPLDCDHKDKDGFCYTTGDV